MISRKVKIFAITGSIILAVGILFFILRGPYLSNSVKRILVPVLENATQERVIIDKAVINPFPFYVQVKGFKVFDKDGNRLLWITKTRAYLDLLGLLSREIRIRKLTMKEPDLTINENDLRRVMDNLRKSDLSGDGGKYRVSLKNMQLTDGNVKYISADTLSGISGSGLYLDMTPKGISHIISVLLKKGTLKLANGSELDGSLNCRMKIKNNRIEVSGFNISSSGSSFSTDGEFVLSKEGKIEDGSFSVKAKIYESTINNIYPLKQERDGVLSFDGFVRLVQREDSNWPVFVLDLKTDSRFYLETLMEILEVDQNITGELSVKGTIEGAFPGITGKGDAKLKNAVLDTLPLDDAEGEVTYKDNKFTLHGITAHTYDGKIEGDGHVIIPSGDYMADAHFSGIDSLQFFKFIQWEPPFPKGELSGDFKLYHEEGHDIEVIADVDYLNTSPKEGNVSDRLKSAAGGLELRDNILWVTDMVLSTGRTDLLLDGAIDFNEEMIDLNLKVDSMDAADLTAPYYTSLSAPVRFEGKLAGPAHDPEIKGRAAAEAGAVQGVKFTKAFADLKYRTSSLIVDKLVINQGDAECAASGTIDFRRAEGFFSFKGPFYKAKAEIRNADIKPLVGASYKDIPVSGRVSGKVSFEGDPDNFVSPGDLTVSDSDIFGQPFDKITVRYEVRPKEIEFKSVKAHRAKSNLEAKGTLSFNKKFNAVVSSDKIRLSDLSAFHGLPVDMAFKFEINGTGTIDNPDLKFSATIDESSFRDVPVGKGEITGTLNNKKLHAKGSFIDGLITADGGAVLSDKITWNINSRFNRGRYDFLLKGYMKEVPDDFLLTLDGRVDMEGQGDKISIGSKFTSAGVSLYGYDLTNRGDIDFELEDDNLRIKSFYLAGNKVDLFVAGAVKLYNNYNLHMRGNMEIAPLRALSDKIAALRGMGRFEVDVSGAWMKPEVYGEISIKDATATVTELPYKIGPVNGAFFLKKDRITFDSVNSKFAGGSVDLSGAGYLDGLLLKRLFLSADIKGIKIKPAEGLNAELDGKLFYDTSPKGSSVAGNIDIRKARYTKRIEWKSWLLGLQEANKEHVKYPDFLKDTAVNVRITGDDNIVIDNNIARTPVKIALNLTGSVAHRGLLGRIEANEGTVYFRSREFNILEGSSVDFVDPNGISPIFHIVADTYIGDYYVKLTIDGTMEDFTLAFFSDPPLSETDTLALLTLGQTGKEGKGIESGIAAGEATALITGGIQDTVEEEFQYYTGFERFEIEPHTTAEGAFVPKVTVGKRLFENKLYVIYSTAIGSTEENIIKLEYKIDKNFSVVGSRNEIGSAGADIKYRFEFK